MWMCIHVVQYLCLYKIARKRVNGAHQAAAGERRRENEIKRALSLAKRTYNGGTRTFYNYAPTTTTELQDREPEQ